MQLKPVARTLYKPIEEVLKKDGYTVEERLISVDEVIQAQNEGRLNEVFGSGTAAVISPVGILNYKGENLVVNNNEMGEITRHAYARITGIQNGTATDEFGWVVPVN